MGVDETTGSVQTHSESSAQLVQMAETSVPSGSDVDALVKKIEGICLEARSRGKNTAVRMEICEIKGTRLSKTNPVSLIRTTSLFTKRLWKRQKWSVSSALSRLIG